MAPISIFMKVSKDNAEGFSTTLPPPDLSNRRSPVWPSPPDGAGPGSGAGAP